LRPNLPGRISQLLAILFIVLMMLVIFHKAVADIARLATLHSGEAFWRALGRYLLANLGA